MAQKKKEPWERSNPKPARKKKKLSSSQKKTAKARAKRAGRPYPNLVDNMRVAAKGKKKKKKKKAAKKSR